MAYESANVLAPVAIELFLRVSPMRGAFSNSDTTSTPLRIGKGNFHFQMITYLVVTLVSLIDEQGLMSAQGEKIFEINEHTGLKNL